METREKGFSLIELMVAMVVTLIISGAVFQLVTAGQSAFRKEPAVADRQLNIRMAVDIITQDLFQAGYGIPVFAQAFTDDLDAMGPMGSGGDLADELEIFRASDCPPAKVCDIAGNRGKSITTYELLSACYHLPSLVIMANQEDWALRWADSPGSGASASCNPGNKSGHATFPPGQAPLVNPTEGFANFVPEYMMMGMAIRYRIHADADGIPNLERSEFGGRPDLKGNSTYQIIARGIEDFQVEYENAAGWQNEPGTVSCGTNCGNAGTAEYDTLIRRVRIRLSARVTETGHMTGETRSAALPGIQNAIRGELATEVAPRAATAALQMFGGTL